MTEMEGLRTKEKLRYNTAQIAEWDGQPKKQRDSRHDVDLRYLSEVFLGKHHIRFVTMLGDARLGLVHKRLQRFFQIVLDFAAGELFIKIVLQIQFLPLVEYRGRAVYE